MADENVNDQTGVVVGFGDEGSADGNGLITPTADVNALEIDPATRYLSGHFVHAPWTTTGEDAPGNTAIRLPTSGVPPYRFSSSRPDIASVTAQGKVKGESNGQATITVLDARNMQASYQVVVSNIWRLHVMKFSNNSPWSEALRVIIQLGGTLDPEQSFKALDSLSTVYQLPFPDRGYYWVWASGLDSIGFGSDGSATQPIDRGFIDVRPIQLGAHGAFCFVQAVPAF